VRESLQYEEGTLQHALPRILSVDTLSPRHGQHLPSNRG